MLIDLSHDELALLDTALDDHANRTKTLANTYTSLPVANEHLLAHAEKTRVLWLKLRRKQFDALNVPLNFPRPYLVKSH